MNIKLYNISKLVLYSSTKPYLVVKFMRKNKLPFKTEIFYRYRGNNKIRNTIAIGSKIGTYLFLFFKYYYTEAPNPFY